MPTRLVIGLASGSSGDGVDAALVEMQGAGLEMRSQLLHALHQPFAPELRWCPRIENSRAVFWNNRSART